MSTPNTYSSCLDDLVLEADPLTLVTLLYRGAVDAVRAGRASLAKGDIAERSRQISKATSIVNELAMSLDHSQGGEVSRNLAELYDYMARRLNQANREQIEQPLTEVESLLTTLLEAWQLCQDAAAAKAPSGYREQVNQPEYRPLSCIA